MILDERDWLGLVWLVGLLLPFAGLLYRMLRQPTGFDTTEAGQCDPARHGKAERHERA